MDADIVDGCDSVVFAPDLLKSFSQISMLQKFFIFPSDPAMLDGLDLTEEERAVLIDNINRRLTPQAVKIRAGHSTLNINSAINMY